MALNLEIDYINNNVIAIRNDGLFISADSDGIVRHNRNWCREWELYKTYEITGTRLQSVGAEKKFQNRGQALIAAEAEDHGRNIVVHGQETHFTISGFFNRSTSLDAVNRRLALELEKANPGHCRIISNNSLVDAASLEDLEKLREMSCRPVSTDGLHVFIHHRWPITVPAPAGI